ncbi:hypothetical protein [Streptomyces sp. NPDC088350]|uniref:hypothetical protein n=1 Tax=Streptomyces sp. NPDC088350 TaxID=3365854 RepID=UPI00382B13C7
MSERGRPAHASKLNNAYDLLRLASTLGQVPLLSTEFTTVPVPRGQRPLPSDAPRVTHYGPIR